MIGYENATEVIEILTESIDCDTVSWFKFCDDESEQKNAVPEPAEVEQICVKYFRKYEAGVDGSTPIAIVDIDVISAPCFSLQIVDFTELKVGKILTNIQSAHNCMKLKL